MMSHLVPQAGRPLAATGIRARPLISLLPIVLVFYSFLFLPPEAEISIFGVSLPSYRQAALLMAAPALWLISKDRNGLNSIIDAAVLFIGFWMLLSFMTIYGVESGFVRGMGILIDNILVYVIARASVRTPDELRQFLLLCLPAVVFAGAIMTAESLSGRLLMRPFFASVFGALDAFAGGETTGSLVLVSEYRLGLLRAYGPFPHPILGGAVMIGFLPLYYFSGLRSWPYFLAIAVALTGFFSLSSAAFLALIVSFGGIAIYYIKPYFPNVSWWLVVAMLTLLIWVAHVSSNGGILSVISRLTLTPHTADYRMLIWEYGSITVAKNPWFGLGYQQWERLRWMTGDSVDAHFLLLAMRHGLIVPVVLLAAMGFGMIRLGMVIPTLSLRDRNFMIGMNMTMIVYLLVGQTVNFFGSAGLVFMTMVAFLASMVEWADAEKWAQTELRLMLFRRKIASAMA
jgi:O-antigen ligase